MTDRHAARVPHLQAVTRQMHRQPEATHLPTADRAKRLAGLDGARVAATLGVVWFHSIESDALRASGVLGRSSVAFYTMAAMLFLADSASRRPRTLAAYSLDRLRRLYLPFLGWSAITLMVAYLLSGNGAPADLPRLSGDLLVDGGTLHLWYVPFLLVASVFVYPAALWMRGSTARRALIAFLCLIVAVTLDLDLIHAPSLHVPVLMRFCELTTDRWSAVYWGVAAGVLWTSGLATSRWRWPVAVMGGFLLVATTAWQWTYGLNVVLKVYGGLGLLLVAIAPWQNAVSYFLARYGRMSAGVYFAHMAAIYVLRGILSANGVADGGWARDIAVFIGATLLCFATVSALSVTPALQWLAGYDATQARPLPTLKPGVAAGPG